MDDQGTFPSEVYRYVGVRLKQLRHDHGLTQSDVAAIINISAQQYQKYEDASSKCSLVTIYQLANYYAVDVDEILPIVPHSNDGSPPSKSREQAKQAEQTKVSDADLVARLISSFMSIPNIGLRQSIVTMVEHAQKSAERANE